ncbi:serine hydrolase [Maribacter aestuarii]|uniref:serine hydrolase n=1 Tax=Maribacter aestuarii TaxID=1130723 RepID=UPI00248C69B2|nr:serine hydrolase [Maribacter aestuarii]
MKNSISLFVFTISLFLITNLAKGQNLALQFDDLITKQYKPEDPGITALVYKNGETLYRKAFGMANLELGVKMTPEHVFELGSITKQFTAVSILMLMEQGKLSLEDEITKFLPDYPTNGQRITVHHLLNHTSGIKSYTNMGDLISFARIDRTPIEIIDYFKNAPMDFNPGEKWNYNNSGYILLGFIIEKVSGQSYADFIQEHIYEPLGMKNSFYGSKTKLIPKRASGYQPSEEGFRNADFISMTLPYAAGSLMSNVDDMLRWHKAIHNNELIKESSKKLAFTNTFLNNGKKTNYGYGWQIDEIQDLPSIEHGGGIFGYVTHGVYAPDENVYVILLTNRNGSSPQEIAVKMAALAMGKPYPDAESGIALPNEKLEKWVGNYEFENEVIRSITMKDGLLFSRRDGSENLKLFPVSENRFYFDRGTAFYDFSMKEGKKEVVFNSRINKDIGVETDKMPVTEKNEIAVDASQLEEYVGVYELSSQFKITVTVNDGKIYGQATGQPQFEMFAESKDTFFLKVVAAQIIFSRDDDGAVTALTLNQGGQSLKGIKS